MGLGATAGSDIAKCAVSSRDVALGESDVALGDATRSCFIQPETAKVSLTAVMTVIVG